MIGFLRGKVAHVFSDYCFLDVRDVGYRVFISHATRTHLSVGEEVMLYVHTHVREDAILLYGFFSQDWYFRNRAKGSAGDSLRDDGK